MCELTVQTLKPSMLLLIDTNYTTNTTCVAISIVCGYVGMSFTLT